MTFEKYFAPMCISSKRIDQTQASSRDQNLSITVSEHTHLTRTSYVQEFRQILIPHFFFINQIEQC